MTIKSFVIIFIVMAFSCQVQKLKFINSASYPDVKEERLGQSPYYMKCPSNMFIEEARGKEGQLGYGLWPIDSINRYVNPSGFIEIKPGRPTGWKPDCDISVEKVRSNLLDGTITWTICKSETGNYYSAIACHNKLTLSASSGTRPGLDSIIAIIATLKSR